MRAGLRNCRVTFYRPTISAQTASGEDTVTDVSLGSAWVQIRALAGRELEAAQQIFAEARFRVEIEHPLDEYTLQRKDKITWGSRTLDILDVEDPTQTRRSQVILAKEHTS